MALLLVALMLPGAVNGAFAHPVDHTCTGLFHFSPGSGCGDPSSVFSESGMIVVLSATAMALSVSMLFFGKYYLSRKDFYTVR